MSRMFVLTYSNEELLAVQSYDEYGDPKEQSQGQPNVTKTLR